MMDAPSLLRLAIEDNIAWCQAVCAAHGSQDALSAGIWANLNPSPPLYPNIITRAAGSEGEVVAAIGQIRSRHPSLPLAVKDSFADLTLQDHGFGCVLTGDWYGYTPERPAEEDCRGWAKVSSPGALRHWESAWNGKAGEMIFSDSLLRDERITFWHRNHGAEITSGFISFASPRAIGVSNWFSPQHDPRLPAGMLEMVTLNFAGRPVVMWSIDDLGGDHDGRKKLGPMKVWVQAATEK